MLPARGMTRRWPRLFGRRRARFGLLTYTTPNLGDVIQSVAARKFLPRVDHYIDREELDAARSRHSGPLKLIMNGWFCHHPERWPPAASVQPLLISFHVTDNPEPGSGVRARRAFAEMPEVLRYLRQNGPVGARDIGTLEWLRSHGVAGYYSGCLTLTLDRPAVGREPFIALNEVPDAVAACIESKTDRPIVRTTHHDQVTAGIEARLRRAADLIAIYAKASCVVTTRLHGALPCLAMGTPVLLIDSSWDQSRFSGLNELVHHCSPQQLVSGEVEYDVDSPPPNPAKHVAMRDDLERRVAAFIDA